MSHLPTPAASTGATRIDEFDCPTLSGWAVLPVHLAATGVLAFMAFLAFMAADGGAGVMGAMFLAFMAVVAFFLGMGGYTALEPNTAAVAMFVGNYKGTIRQTGLRYHVPWVSTTKVSQRSQNFDSSKLKVNDLDGNPIEIGAVVVWRVDRPASALLAVDDYEDFVKIQTESAVRTLANHYAYDSHDDGVPSLRDNPEKIVAELTSHIQERLDEAGIQIIEARISHLAYAPEIAQAMLQRQQASAIVAARTRIVAGAVGMVEMALAELSKNNIVELDEERKAQMVSNLLVVLCGDRSAQPIVNAGSIHS